MRNCCLPVEVRKGSRLRAKDEWEKHWIHVSLLLYHHRQQNIFSVLGKEQSTLWWNVSRLIKEKMPLCVWNDTELLCGLLETWASQLPWNRGSLGDEKIGVVAYLRLWGLFQPRLVTSTGVSRKSIWKRRQCCWFFLFSFLRAPNPPFLSLQNTLPWKRYPHGVSTVPLAFRVVQLGTAPEVPFLSNPYEFPREHQLNF